MERCAKAMFLEPMQLLINKFVLAPGETATANCNLQIITHRAQKLCRHGLCAAKCSQTEALSDWSNHHTHVEFSPASNSPYEICEIYNNENVGVWMSKSMGTAASAFMML